MLKRKICDEPNQYILGKWDFGGRVFLVKKPILSPRLETNDLMEMAKGFLLEKNEEKMMVLDVGCGSGVIGISLFLDTLEQVKGLSVDCLDIEKTAVRVTKENFEALCPKNKGKINEEETRGFRVFQGDFKSFDFEGKKYDLVVSNPPYLGKKEWEGLPRHIRNNESKKALVSGEDGAELTRVLIQRCSELLRENGCLMIESGPSVLEQIEKKEIEWEETFGEMRIVKDVFGLNRFAVFNKK